MPCTTSSIEESEDLASELLPTSLLVVHDALGRREDHASELPGRQNSADPGFDVTGANIVTGRDDSCIFRVSTGK